MSKTATYTRAKFEADMRSMGWAPGGVLGYWHRNGHGISELNYRDLPTAIRAFRAAMRKHDKEAAERRAAKALRDAAHDLRDALRAWVDEHDATRREQAALEGNPPEPCYCARCEQARAALAKARGEEAGA